MSEAGAGSDVVLHRVLSGEAVRAQVVAEAREHVRRFDWAEVAKHTRRVYRAAVGAPVSSGPGPR